MVCYLPNILHSSNAIQTCVTNRKVFLLIHHSNTNNLCRTHLIDFLQAWSFEFGYIRYYHHTIFSTDSSHTHTHTHTHSLKFCPSLRLSNSATALCETPLDIVSVTTLSVVVSTIDRTSYYTSWIVGMFSIKIYSLLKTCLPIFRLMSSIMDMTKFKVKSTFVS